MNIQIIKKLLIFPFVLTDFHHLYFFARDERTVTKRSIALVMNLILYACPFLLLVAAESAVGQCPVWFKETENGSCVCGPELGGQIQCSQASQSASISYSFCMTYDNSSQQLLTGNCGNRIIEDHNRVYYPLPGLYDLNTVCDRSGRKGFLCGECKEKWGQVINSLRDRCKKCDNTLIESLGEYLLLRLILTTLYFILVITFRLNLASGKIMGYIIFCQNVAIVSMMSSGFLYTIHSTIDGFGAFLFYVTLSLSGMWSYFVTLPYILPEICLHRNMSKLQVICLEYIFALYPLVLILVSWICIELHARNVKLVVWMWKPFHKCLVRVRKTCSWSVNDSVIHAYATFYFLSLWTLCQTTFSLIYSTDVFNINGTISNVVLVLDPTIASWSMMHLPYLVPALFLYFVLGVFPTALLLLHSTRCFRQYCAFFTLRPRVKLLADIFFSTFSGCYKNGLNNTSDYTYLSSVPMIIVLLYVPAFNLSTLNYLGLMYTPALLCFVCFVLSIIYAYIKPYNSSYMNMSIPFHLAVIGFWAGIYLLWLEGDIISSKTLAVSFTLVSSLPHVVAAITLGYYIVRHSGLMKIKGFRVCCALLVTICHKSPSNYNPSDSLPDRLQNSYKYRTLSIPNMM